MTWSTQRENLLPEYNCAYFPQTQGWELLCRLSCLVTKINPDTFVSMIHRIGPLIGPFVLKDFKQKVHFLTRMLEGQGNKASWQIPRYKVFGRWYCTEAILCLRLPENGKKQAISEGQLKASMNALVLIQDLHSRSMGNSAVFAAA